MTSTETNAAQANSPVLKVTRYDRVSASMIAFVVALVGSVIWLTVLWGTNRLSSPQRAVPVELVELAGGVDDGAVDETLRLESPAEETQDPSLAETIAEESEIQEMLESVVELADEATDQAQRQFELEAQNAGKPGSAKGTGRRALGMGPGEAGLPREQRWFMRFSEGGTLDGYAEQLSFFGIELGVLRANGKLDYLYDITAKKPKIRSVSSGKGENRLYMTWRGGNRRISDIQLFERAGSYVGQGLILHFYPPKTEARLARLERNHRDRLVEQIRRTYFAVRRNSTGYEFIVTKQSYFQ